MKALFIFMIAGVLCSNCNNAVDEKKTTGNQAKGSDSIIAITKTAEQLAGCYQAIIGKDTAALQLNVSENMVSGSLLYNRFEKDDSKGNFTGKIDNNIIRAWYVFQSEGTVSVKELFFRIDNGKLAEGYGEMDMKHDTAVFRYPTALRYEENHPYLKVNCN